MTSEWERQYMGQFDIASVGQAVGQAAQGVAKAAQGAQYLQSPEFQQEVKQVSQDVQMYAYAQLGLQTVATVATFGFFLIMLYNFIREQKTGKRAKGAH